MTSEIEVLKTNEFLRRRKLRLQQVREQSKDIAKQIRQRAKVEQLKQVVDLDAKKQKEYLERQGELVKKLEDLYAKGVSNIGTSHKNAVETQCEEQGRVDLSKLRGREAAAELKRKKQEKLDEQKKLLDRKLQAREAANELSREKSSTVATKFSKKDTDNTQSKSVSKEDSTNKNTENVDTDKDKPVTNDMATQWDIEGLTNEWETNIPALSLPKDDNVKETNNNIESKSDRSKRLDLFALSEEMPTSLRGGLAQVDDRIPVKPSLTLVSEYLQSRGMRLRESGTTSKKQTEDLQSIKQTILRTRSSRPEGSPMNACHVLDEQIIPVPSWRAEKYCKLCSHSAAPHNERAQCNVTNSEFVKYFSSKQSTKPDILPSSDSRRTSPLKRNKVSAKSNTDKSTKSTVPDSGLTKKSSVMMYNHSTRDTRDVPTCDERLVVRDDQNQEDAYSQAVKESTIDKNKDEEHQKKIQNMRNKVAMTKQSIEKEYKDTINFLNSLPKDTNSRPIHKAYKDQNRQQVQKENRQRKMQQTYKEIERECKKHICKKNHIKSKSPVRNVENDLDSRDFQYSWMPIPESDDNLAIHTIPTMVKQGKPNNSVKFSRVDSYHEYRSRHKHTPPTKDTIGREKQADRKVEAVIIDNDSANSTECSSVSSETSSGENIRLKERGDAKSTVRELSDAERIIIYKILDSKRKGKCKKKAKLLKDVTNLSSTLNKSKTANENHNRDEKKNIDETGNRVSFEHLTEGVYKTVNEKGDNITSMYFPNNQHNCEKVTISPHEIKNGHPCCCNKAINKDQQQNQGTNIQWETGDPTTRISNTCVGCKCGCADHLKPDENNRASVLHSSVATSASSFKTTTNDKASNALPDCGYVKLIDEGGQEAGKFYIGASGFLKDDAYEVVIQLRKKEGNDKADNVVLVNKSNYKDKTNEVITQIPAVTSEDLKGLSDKSTEIKISNKLTNQIKTGSETSDKADSVVLSTRESCINGVYNNIPLETIISENVNTNQPHETEYAVKDKNPLKNLVDKGVDTSFQSHVIPNHGRKTDPPLKLATSTYTQTSINSPNHRPVYFHMSSSTSTAYMSPPEYVLPKFLRQDCPVVNDELYVATEDFTVQDEIETSDQQQYIEENDKCKCKRCIHARNVVLTKTKTQSCCKKHSKNRLSKLATPPNTARTCSTEHGTDVSDHRRKHESHNCCKFISQPDFVTSKKSYSENNKYPMKTNKKTSQRCKTDSNVAKSSKSVCKPNLNPSIKEYVNKLLSLNKEGMKVVEIADQECSSITTPGSSIINNSKNIDKNKPPQSNVSLEQIKNMLKVQILEEYIKKKQEFITCTVPCNKNQFHNNLKVPRNSRRKRVHKVKSLNISRNILKTNTSSCDAKQSADNIASSTSSTKENNDQPVTVIGGKTRFRSKSSPTPRHIHAANVKRKPSSDIPKINKLKDKINVHNSESTTDPSLTNILQNRESFTFPKNRKSKMSIATTSTDSENSIFSKIQESKMEIPITISTQSNENINKEINYMKLAEDKLQNMEKIADLTEKCTRRLSNLARVLDEVRRSKTIAYSQISTSDTASDSDQKSDKNVPSTKSGREINDQKANKDISSMKVRKEINDLIVDAPKTPERKSPVSITETVNKSDVLPDSTDFVPILNNIPKPNVFKSSDYNLESPKSNSNLFIPVTNIDNCVSKTRAKPPPALMRLHFKNGQDHVIPHELSTVLEVDSPISLKLKTTSSRDTKDDETGSNDSSVKAKKSNNAERYSIDKELCVNPDLLQSNLNTQQSKVSLTESSDDSKLQMMDLNQFNEIMLKPFITFKEHAKRCNIVINEGSNLDDNPKGTATDDISSLHSDGSLPDVVAELLKRNVITEPFKYETASNVNSTTMSSESTLSVLALSKVRKKKHSGMTFHNKESIGETSDSLSVSSNPDLENAFKKLGMGWASSTLKKTKERLALSSSSNTSSTSISQYKLKSFNNQDISNGPALVTDSVSTILNLSKKPGKERNISDNKNAEQQTSLTNSMTVKEFLTNELANKITFTNKSRRDDTEEEFVSLFETKMPENMKDTSALNPEDCSGNSGNSANNNRARTSTPVQVFKSTTYHSSSSSNMSNGLFSNADDLSSVKVTSNSKNKHSTSDKDDLTVPNFSLKLKKSLSDCSKSE